MRTGVIFYVVGENPMRENTDIGTEIRKIEPKTERVEVVAKCTGHFDIADAWLDSYGKGDRQFDLKLEDYKGQAPVPAPTIACGDRVCDQVNTFPGHRPWKRLRRRKGSPNRGFYPCFSWHREG